ncbi:MAG: slipin family protein, partial [Chloroflexi bacterium]|nr:slipin family protein [Chloroflexota bacterium]
MNVAAVVAIAVVIVLIILFFSAVKVVQQYELGVVFRLGRLVGTKKPGIRLIVPFIDYMKKIDTRVVT